MELANVIIVDFLELPKDLQQDVKDQEAFRNDIYLEHYSDWELEEISYRQFRKCYEESTVYGVRSLEEFIDEYFKLEKWILDQGTIDVSNISKILIKVCW